MAYIANPRYEHGSGHGRQPGPGPKPGRVTTSERQQISAAIAAALDTVDPAQEHVTVHEITVKVRAALPGIAPTKYDGATIAALLGDLGHEVYQ